MGKIIAFLTYAFYGLFCLRLLQQFLVWRAEDRSFFSPSTPYTKIVAPALIIAAWDIFFFRRVFSVNKPFWFAEWMFHVSIFFVVVRHLRYFLLPAPDCVAFMQPAGIFAGYLLPVSLFFILVLRLTAKSVKYASARNYFLLLLLLCISLSGVLMHAWYRPDLIDVKGFVMGILTLQPSGLPASPLFIVHFLLVLLLVPYLPLHMFAAPFVMIDARQRDEGLNRMMHDKL